MLSHSGRLPYPIHTANTAADNTRHHHKPRKCPSGEESIKPRREFYIPRCDLYISQRGFYISRRDLQFVMPDSQLRSAGADVRRAACEMRPNCHPHRRRIPASDRKIRLFFTPHSTRLHYLCGKQLRLWPQNTQNHEKKSYPPVTRLLTQSDAHTATLSTAHTIHSPTYAENPSGSPWHELWDRTRR